MHLFTVSSWPRGRPNKTGQTIASQLEGRGYVCGTKPRARHYVMGIHIICMD